MLLPLCATIAQAQESDPVDRIYERHPGEKFSIGFNLNAGLFDDLEIDIDTDEVEQHIEGTFRRVRFIYFEEYDAALRSEKKIIEELFDEDYELAEVPKEWQEENSQLLIFKKKDSRVSPHLIIIVNDRDDRDVTLLILSGSIIYKTDAL